MYGRGKQIFFIEKNTIRNQFFCKFFVLKKTCVKKKRLKNGLFFLNWVLKQNFSVS